MYNIFYLFVLLSYSTAADKRGMGGPAEKRRRRTGAEEAEKARPRGDTGPRRITGRETYPPLCSFQHHMNPTTEDYLTHALALYTFQKNP